MKFWNWVQLFQSQSWIYCISSYSFCSLNSFLSWIVSAPLAYVLWPLHFQIQKRIVSAETIWGNTVCTILWNGGPIKSCQNISVFGTYVMSSFLCAMIPNTMWTLVMCHEFHELSSNNLVTNHSGVNNFWRRNLIWMHLYFPEVFLWFSY